MATSSFGRAFASARKAGKKTFSWNGKKYTTEVAKKTPEKGPVPKARPSTKGKQKDLGKSTGKVPVPKANPRKASASAATPSKVPVPTPKPKQDIGASPKTGKVPVPKSNPRNAPAVGSAKKGSPMAVAAQRNREKPVKGPNMSAPAASNRKARREDKKKPRGILSILFGK
jgi:hypothetical protein